MSWGHFCRGMEAKSGIPSEESLKNPVERKRHEFCEKNTPF